jgi:hypothetical protein
MLIIVCIRNSCEVLTAWSHIFSIAEITPLMSFISHIWWIICTYYKNKCLRNCMLKAYRLSKYVFHFTELWAIWLGGGAVVTKKGVAPCASRTRCRLRARTIWTTWRLMPSTRKRAHHSPPRFLDWLMSWSASCVASCDGAHWRLGTWWSRRVGEGECGGDVAVAAHPAGSGSNVDTKHSGKTLFLS